MGSLGYADNTEEVALSCTARAPEDWLQVMG